MLASTSPSVACICTAATRTVSGGVCARAGGRATAAAPAMTTRLIRVLREMCCCINRLSVLSHGWRHGPNDDPRLAGFRAPLAVRLTLIRNFLFSISKPLLYTPKARCQRLFRSGRASAPSGSQVCSFGMESARQPDPFFRDSSDTSPSPPAYFPRFSPPVADSTRRARAPTRSAVPSHLEVQIRLSSCVRPRSRVSY